mmetsp:Transcript_48158/g.112633  ORF Transcript_48158/g.112633 Transcript_48158/m.112633 type:complete len:307 (+) Transcript_48158:680-1600(+)
MDLDNFCFNNEKPSASRSAAETWLTTSHSTPTSKLRNIIDSSMKRRKRRPKNGASSIKARRMMLGESRNTPRKIKVSIDRAMPSNSPAMEQSTGIVWTKMRLKEYNNTTSNNSVTNTDLVARTIPLTIIISSGRRPESRSTLASRFIRNNRANRKTAKFLNTPLCSPDWKGSIHMSRNIRNVSMALKRKSELLVQLHHGLNVMKWRAASVAKKIRKRHSIRTLMTISTGPNPARLSLRDAVAPNHAKFNKIIPDVSSENHTLRTICLQRSNQGDKSGPVIELALQMLLSPSNLPNRGLAATPFLIM